MKQLSLRERLLKYLLNRHSTWFASGDLQRLVMAETKYTARTAVRRLEELAEEGKLQVEIRNGHAFYKAPQSNHKPATAILPPKHTSSQDHLKRSAEMVRLFDSGAPMEEVLSV